MKKIKLPQKPFKGLKTFCKICRINNSKCSHTEHLIFRAVIKIPGGCGSVRTKLLIEMGMNNNNNPNDFILYPERSVTTNVIMDRLSKSFTHYKKGAGIEKDISFKNLRKTYITWVNQAMGNQTGVLTSHSTNEVLEKFYLDPKVLSAVEKGALEIKIFGSKNDLDINRKVTHKGDTNKKTI